MKFYTFGDSHSAVFKDSKYFTEQFWFGGWTMHRFGRDLNNLADLYCSPFGIRHYSIPNDGIILASFGEIDVRAHIHTQVQLGRDIHEICNTLATNYIRHLCINRELNGYDKIAVLAVNPCRRQHNYICAQTPMKGTDEERKLYHDTLNSYLKTQCELNDIYFFDLNPYYTDEGGMLNDNLRDDTVHIIFTEHIDKEIERAIDHFSSKTTA